jgi:hypothetical protein
MAPAGSNKSAAPNQLTEADRAAGWRLLFDGESLAGWRGYRREDVPASWKAVDGTLAFSPGTDGGDLITTEEFGNFEFALEWKISPGGNSGIMFRVTEEHNWPWESGAEVQVLDNIGHVDGKNPLTSAGANYALHAPARDVTRPVGEWNEVRLVVDGSHVEHWLNGTKVVEYELWSDEWKALVAGSKFNEMPRYGLATEGHLCLQDHDDPVWYRNIKIRPL